MDSQEHLKESGVFTHFYFLFAECVNHTIKISRLAFYKNGSIVFDELIDGPWSW